MPMTEQFIGKNESKHYYVTPYDARCDGLNIDYGRQKRKEYTLLREEILEVIKLLDGKIPEDREIIKELKPLDKLFLKERNAWDYVVRYLEGQEDNLHHVPADYATLVDNYFAELNFAS